MNKKHCLVLEGDNKENVVAFQIKLNFRHLWYTRHLQHFWKKLLGKTTANKETNMNLNDDLSEIEEMFLAIRDISDNAQILWLESDNNPGLQILNDDGILWKNNGQWLIMKMIGVGKVNKRKKWPKSWRHVYSSSDLLQTTKVQLSCSISIAEENGWFRESPRKKYQIWFKWTSNFKIDQKYEIPFII